MSENGLGDLTDLASDIDLEAADLSLPEEYATEVMANELLEHLATYWKVQAALRAARQAEQHDRAEQFAKQALFSRMAIAGIQGKYSKAKAIADEVARLRAHQAAAQRAAMLV